MNTITSIKRAVTVASLASAGLFLPASVHAVQLTYDMRIVSASDGTQVTDAHNFTAMTAGDVITVDLYAVIASTDSNHANDGFANGQGSFLSAGLLKGGLRGDGVTTSQVNNIAPFNAASLSQSGYAQDLNNDGFIDVGSLSTVNVFVPGTVSTSPWFEANAGTATIFGTGAGSGNTEFLIGQTTFTLADGAVAGQQTVLQFVPRVRTDGGIIATQVHHFTIDGVARNLAGTDTTDIAAISATVTYLVPEPSAIGMILLGAIGLVGFRRSAIRSSLA